MPLQAAALEGPATTPAASTSAQGSAYPQQGSAVVTSYEGEGEAYTLGRRLYRALASRPYERTPADPLYRPLRIFTLDPATPMREGAVTTVNIAFEPLEIGPAGRVFEVDARDGTHGVAYRQVDLETRDVLIRNGRVPSIADPEFHQQMVYAVASTVYDSFRRALGRDPGWGFQREPVGTEPLRLMLRPHGGHQRNAYYDPTDGSITFGYYRADEVVGGNNLPGGLVFTCLSHDIIAHEVSHALLDGLRAHFALPTGPDVLAFHEAFADLVAVFQHFSHAAVVEAAIRASGARLDRATLLTDIATQFGHTTGSKQALRTAIEPNQDPEQLPQYANASAEPHERGRLLTAAVFDAFATVYARKVERYIRLATGGTGVLPPGELPAELRKLLAEEASQLAQQFLAMCIRAIDYCPPVDLHFGEFLRAVITADMDLVPDDRWGYRAAWIDAFRRRGIYPGDVTSLSEDALLWRPPRADITEEPELCFGALRFAGDPGRVAGYNELRRQACMLGRLITQPQYREELGLAENGDPRLNGDTVDPPCIESMRTTRRVGPNGQVVFDLVAEVTQCRYTTDESNNIAFRHYGGATVILNPMGGIRYVVSRSVLRQKWLQQHRDYIAGPGARFHSAKNGELAPRDKLFSIVHTITPR